MRKKNQQKRQISQRKSLNKQVQQLSIKPRKKATPFADAGAIAGRGLGTMFGMPYLSGVGKWLGSGIGSIFGSGDYQMVGGAPGYNVLTNGAQIPQFSTSRATNVISHREYLGDVQGTAGFNNTSYPLNPGMASTFPWLATIAQCYQEYRFHGLIFEFRPLITDFVTNGAPGVVVMATNYNADAAIYNTKQEMENSEFAVSVKPTCSLIHGIECELNQTVLPQLYVRSGTPPSGQDLRLYDQGNFQFATQTNPVQALGELWVSYTVEFFKPVLPTDVGGNVLSYHTSKTPFTNLAPLGTTVFSSSGDLNVRVTNGSILIPGQPGNSYIVVISWFGPATAVTAPTWVTAGAVDRPLWVNDSSVIAKAGDTAASPALILSKIITCTLLVPGDITITIGTAGLLPVGGGSTVDVHVTQYSSEVTA
jgi:hypothetical protein